MATLTCESFDARAEKEPRYVGDNPDDSSYNPYASSQASASADAAGEDKFANPYFPPNLPVRLPSSPPRPSTGQKGFPIFVASSPPRQAHDAEVVSGDADSDSKDEDDPVIIVNTPLMRLEPPALKGPWYSVTQGTYVGVVRTWALASSYVNGVPSASFTSHKVEADAYLTYSEALRAKVVRKVIM
ncbi:hypothetical protein BD410DRAFT_844537 [Rickenella mellea]|uniref:Ribonuclease H1 N-terminal domain-containing protein n=1 Tax=Rickenella mellea TaxID=50990 RepID=A0A4Y7PMH8_9AGAM|nr:hypothetical protein BD410DRAFT_844537 [Rickenella mellea]